MLTKPHRLCPGDTIATVSPSFGWAGDAAVHWAYALGKKRLEECFGLRVAAAPNAMRGSEYLVQNPAARAEDIMWAFERDEVKAIIANIGGNDSDRVVPLIDAAVIKRHPKIFIGYSDAMNLHLLCYKAGLASFYGHNLLTTLAEPGALHPYSEKWFRKVLFDPSPIGPVEPSPDWTCDGLDLHDPDARRVYLPNPVGYELIQGEGVAEGHLLGGHTGMLDAGLSVEDYAGAILFVEDIPEFFSPDQAATFFRRLGQMGALQSLAGVIIGKIKEFGGFDGHAKAIRRVIGDEFGLRKKPVLYGLNFGHTSPMCILPYGAKAQINCEAKAFTIIDSGVV